jgi:hypothetical protein
LRSGKVELWNEIRPRTLLWLAVEEKGVQRFFDPEIMPEIDRILNKASIQKKIPILLPMQDLREQQAVSVADILSAYSEYLLEVSTRYEVVSTLAGKIVKSGKCWKAEWTLYFDAKIEQWRGACTTLDLVIMYGLNGVYDRLSPFYAAKHEITQVESLMIQVSGIKRVSDIMLLTDYLEALPMVKTATWVTTGGGYNTYRVFYQGGRKELDKGVIDGPLLAIESLSKQNLNEVKYRFVNKY